MRFPLPLLLAPVLALAIQLPCLAARVETLDVPSAAMAKSYRANIVLPDAYDQTQASYPVLYLLHGAHGHFDDWLNKTPDKTLVPRLADQYGLIIVMPEGESFSFYLDSPVKKESQFETYLSGEVVPKIDATYRTIADKSGRAITGLSMGGHGALYLATRHPDIFGAAGSMSGAVDIATMDGYTREFESILGRRGVAPDYYAENAIVNMVDAMKANGVPLIIDCGADDFLISYNRDLHQRLLANKTPHDYIERPGAHTWDYWQNALPYQVLFLTKALKTEAAAPKATR